MEFRRTIRTLCVLSPVCVVAVTAGCNKADKRGQWEDALDASAEGEDTRTSEREAGGGKDEEDTSTSNGTTRPTSTGESTATSAGSTTSVDEPSSGGASSDSDEQSDDEAEDSTEDTQSSTTPQPDAGANTTEDNGTSDVEGCEGYLLCETFEDVDVGEIPEGWERRGSDLAVAAGGAHSGERALKIDAASPGPRQLVRDAAVLGSAHWGRVYYRVDLPVPDAFVHSTLVAFGGDATESGASEFRLVNMNKQAADTPNVGSKHNWAYNVQVTGGAEWVCESNYTWQFDEDWHCAEYFVDADAQTYEFYYDGEPITLGSGACDRMELPEVFDELRVGWNYYAEAAPGFTVYVDDVAFDDERIGCD